MASRKNRKHALQRSASTLTASTLSSTSSKTASTFSRIWGSFRRSQSSSSVLSDGFKVVDDNGRINVEIIKSISELDNSVVSFNHGMVETIPPGKDSVITIGQLISKGIFVFFNSPKKRMKNFCPSRLGQKLKKFKFVFRKN